MDTSCRKCGTPMAEAPNGKGAGAGPFAYAKFITTAYKCKKCGHWNDLKRRRGYKEYREALLSKKTA